MATPPSYSNETTKTTSEERAIRERKGGLAPMHLVDAETGSTLHDNRDAKVMAWRSLNSWDISISNREQSIFLSCVECNYKTSRSFRQIFGIGWVCGGCGARHEAIEYPEKANELSDARKTHNAMADTDREVFIYNWYLRKTLVARYTNIIKGIPSKVKKLAELSLGYISRKYNNIKWAYEVIKTSYSRD